MERTEMITARLVTAGTVVSVRRKKGSFFEVRDAVGLTLVGD